MTLIQQHGKCGRTTIRAALTVDTNHYSVPWRLIGATVTIRVGDGLVRIHHAGGEVACHDQRLGRRERAVERAHLLGIVPDQRGPEQGSLPEAAPAGTQPAADLLRPLAEYEQVAGGGW
ncbi:Mu transposase domain-containing protein [Teichococcus aestuarii]|uniref:Transposase for insertion sequence element IS21-like C-terminal domain-containing protein n=1 Tax=Teichococcus aestuarii TaxID=568898 RepID=A0A2U1UYS0_9PROT|nr:hypothetical protein [Pseudoroseomonas aestuarii]PWC26808.1 hypothetical protein CR165_21345 [Pseudoroseomonas aestuarii]